MSKLILTPYESIVQEECITTNYGLKFEGNSSFGYVEYSPFGNCQIYSVAQAKHILYCNRDTAIQAFTDIFQIVQKNQMMIDIPYFMQGAVDEIFKGCITLKTPYINTTGNEMVIYLINMSKFYYNDEKIESPNETLLVQLFEKWKNNDLVVQVSSDLLHKYSSYSLIKKNLNKNITYNISLYHDTNKESEENYYKSLFDSGEMRFIKIDENIKADLIIDSRTGHNGVNGGIELLLQLIERIKQHESI